MARNYPESVLEAQFKKWLFYEYRDISKVAYKIPNEGKRKVRTGKLMGLTKGMLDFCIPVGRGGKHALYIEFKIKPNKPSIEQLDIIERLKSFNNVAVVCYTLEECMQVTKDYLGYKGGDYD